MTEQEIKTAQTRLKKHFKGRTLLAVAKASELTAYRVKRSVNGKKPIIQDVEFLLTFMEWELKANETKPLPPKAKCHRWETKK
jgi:hypothetical protein